MSTLKTAWLNLQDGLGKRFAWSHVKAIFYNYAEHKLLSTKLDEMDTAINSKVNKADIVQTESTATDKVPSAAYLKEIKDGLDNDIGELTSSVKFGTGAYNLKELTSKGIYWCFSSSQGLPESNKGGALFISSDDPSSPNVSIVQKFIVLENGHEYTIRKQSGVWGEWVQS